VIPVEEAVLPYFWAPVDDAEAIVETLRAAAFTETVEAVDRTGEEAVFRVEWSATVRTRDSLWSWRTFARPRSRRPRTSVSQRLRRGLASLLAATIEGGRSDASTRRGPDG
jgi:hypothetical protein